MAPIARILNEAIGSWLHFERCCNRTKLFNEKYLSFPIGQVLSAQFGERVHAEFTHPQLSAGMVGPGRRPQVDFVCCETWPTPTVAVETKWIGRTKVAVEDIIWDLVRLELIAASSGATCMFVLGGKRRDLESLFASDAFTGGEGMSHRRPILSTASNTHYVLWLVPQHHYRTDLLRRVFKNAQDVSVPHRLITRRTAPFPLASLADAYQVYSWTVSPAPNRLTFKPGEHPQYKVAKAEM